VVQVGRFKKFLEMIFGWLCLVLEVAFGCRYAFLTRVNDFLITTAIAGYNDDAIGSPLLPFIATLGAFPSALSGGLVGAA
jgi:hypothetical protein